jgi:glycosyltransferase involved in cell wall biosynthesis
MSPPPEPQAGRPAVLLAVDLYPDGGGISAIVENCLQALGDRYDVHVAIVDQRAGRRESLRLPDDRVHVYGSRPILKPYLAPTSVLYSLRIGWFLRGLVRRIKPRALLVQDGLFLPVPGLLATHRTPVKLAVMDHGTLTNSLDPEWQRIFPTQMDFPKSLVFRVGFALDRPWRELRWRLGFRYADAVWYVGEEMKPYLGPAGARARQYRQPVPMDFSAPTGPQRRAAREAFGLDDDDLVVNMVTRLAAEKGLPEILEALRALAPLHPRLRVLAAGHGPLEDWFRNELRAAGLEDRVTMVGRLGRPEVLRLHHASDFHLYGGTIGCGMSLALLEAMSAGVIPIVSDIPRQHRELAVPAGWVYPAGNADALTQALNEALACGADARAARSSAAVEAVRAYARPSVGDHLRELIGDDQHAWSTAPPNRPESESESESSLTLGSG